MANVDEMIKNPSVLAFQHAQIQQLKKKVKELEDRLAKANKILRNDPNFNYREQ